MSANDAALAWSEEQWAGVRRAVLESARKARVAASFLPLAGPLPASATTVPAMRLERAVVDHRQRGESAERLAVDESQVIALTTIAADVYLRNSEAADPDLASAMSMFRRAADVVARVEDAIVFNGQPAAGATPERDGEPVVRPAIYTVHGGLPNPGLLGAGDADLDVAVAHGGEHIVGAVVEAIQRLERNGQFGPFACVLGTALFLQANTPTGSLVLPSDRMLPFLDGPLLRSSTVPDDAGLVIALAADPVDLVVATDMSVKFLQLSLEPRYVFRVYERIALRVRQPDAICRLGRARDA